MGAHLGRDLVNTDAGHLGRRAGMDILSLPESVHHGVIARKMRQDAQLNLAVISIHQHVPRGRHKGAADLPSQIGAHRNILQVGLGAGNAPRGRAGLVKEGMDAALVVHLADQRVNIGAVQFAHLPVFQDIADGGMGIPQRLQRFGVGGKAFAGLSPGLETQPVEQHVAQLLGAVDIELAHAAQGIDALPQRVLPGRQARADFPQHVGIHPEAFALHIK